MYQVRDMDSHWMEIQSKRVRKIKTDVCEAKLCSKSATNTIQKPKLSRSISNNLTILRLLNSLTFASLLYFSGFLSSRSLFVSSLLPSCLPCFLSFHPICIPSCIHFIPSLIRFVPSFNRRFDQIAKIWKCPEVSKRLQTHRNASDCIQTHPSTSERVRTRSKMSITSKS